MELWALKSRLIANNSVLFDEIIEILKKNKKKLKNSDILVISSKVVAICEGNYIDMTNNSQITLNKSVLNGKNGINDLEETHKKQRQKLNLSLSDKERPVLAALIEKEADYVMPGEYYLTVKDNIFVANAGIDESNMPENQVVLWPKNSYETAEKIRKKLISYFGLKDLGIIIADSVCHPLRQGVIGIALGYSGFKGVIDKIGEKDLYGKKLKVTKMNIADSLATAGNLVMGEGDECTPVVLINDADVQFTNEKILNSEIIMKADKCIFKGLYPKKIK